MDDKFNTIETLEKEFFENDSDFSDVNLFHTKLKADITTYKQHELPAMAVHAFSFEGLEGERKLNYIGTAIEITHRGGDLDTVDGQVKTILSRAINKLRAESPLNHGNGFENQAIEDIRIDNAEIIFDRINSVFTVIGSLEVAIGVYER